MMQEKGTLDPAFGATLAAAALPVASAVAAASVAGAAASALTRPAAAAAPAAADVERLLHYPQPDVHHQGQLPRGLQRQPRHGDVTNARDAAERTGHTHGLHL